MVSVLKQFKTQKKIIFNKKKINLNVYEIQFEPRFQTFLILYK